jgi:RimJ/RimL family protein N-acetyltransferase
MKKETDRRLLFAFGAPMELTIRTDRLLLRPFRLADAKRVQQLAGDWDVAKMLARLPHPYPDGEAEAWIATHDQTRAAGSAYPFAVTWHESWSDVPASIARETATWSSAIGSARSSGARS